MSLKRAGVCEGEVRKFFDDITRTLQDIPLANIINFDETNLTDDPKSKKLLFHKGCKHPTRVMNTSKSSISLMFACASDGYLFPPYVVYKSQHLMDTWTLVGPIGTVYNRTKSGWFDQYCFTDWFKRIINPYVNSLPDSKKIIFGDNLRHPISAMKCWNLLDFMTSIMYFCQQTALAFFSH